ncbi:hypothetical protein NMG60_11015562 [Bertholletia excelsa]
MSVVPSTSCFHTSPVLPKRFAFALVTALEFATHSSAESYWTHLLQNGSNIERTLNAVKAKLDATCVDQVLQKCAPNKPLLGLRFFIWAGLQPNYRHSSYMYAKAAKLFDINHNPKIVTDVVKTYGAEGCLVSVKTFKIVLNLCQKANLAEEGLWVLRKMNDFNCRPDTTAYNVVIRLFSNKGYMDVAADLMREMGVVNLYPDMITYVAMIKGFCDAGRLEEACALEKFMRKNGCSPNVVVYSALIDGVCRFGSLERALELLQEMEKMDGECKPNIVTYTSVIQCFCEKSRSLEALHILDRMMASGCFPNRVTMTTLIKGLCGEGYLEEAYKLIDKVVAGGCVSYSECHSSLVLCLLGVKNFEEAEKLFRRMLASAIKPDSLASSTMIKSLCLRGRVLDGLYFYNEIEKLGCMSSVDTDIYSILLAGLCNESHLVEAANLARVMIERRIQLKTPYVEYIIKHLKNSGEKELVSHFAGIAK